MKKIAFIFFFFFITEYLHSQNNLYIDVTYFILGTINEQYGLRLTTELNHRIDRYGLNELQLVNFIDSLLKANKYHTSITKRKESYEAFLYCDSMAIKINFFYTPQEVIPATASYPELKGRNIYLKNINFDNDIQKYSFLLGVYLRFGEIQDNQNTIFLPCATKANICLTLLQEIGAKKISNEITEGMSPSEHIFFQPNERFQAYINKYKYLNKKL